MSLLLELLTAKSAASTGMAERLQDIAVRYPAELTRAAEAANLEELAGEHTDRDLGVLVAASVIAGDIATLEDPFRRAALRDSVLAACANLGITRDLLLKAVRRSSTLEAALTRKPDYLAEDESEKAR